VGSPGQLEEWAGRVLREEIAIGAVFLECRNRGCHPDRARDLAEDAVQQALTQAARIADLARRFDNFIHFSNWVRTVVINHVRSVFRKLAPAPLKDWHAAVLPAAEAPAAQALVRALLEELPAEERELFLLHYEEGLTLDQLAERLLPPDGRSGNARRLDIWRRGQDIVRRLRQGLWEGGFGPSPSMG
jgi:RNA polymerase sigma factor (sigma-70 family)